MQNKRLSVARPAIFTTGVFGKNGYKLLLLKVLALSLNSGRAAYITFRYVNNFIHHGQIVFNVNEYVEGQTNILWAALLYITSVVGIQIEHGAVLLSITAYLLFLVRAIQYCKKVNPTPASWFVIILAVLPLGGTIIDNVYSGLETVFYAYLIAEAMWRLAKKEIVPLALVCGLVFATRPEGVMLGIVMLSAYIFRYGYSTKAVSVASASFIAMVFGLTLFRYFYYGDFVPNSIVAKSLPLAIITGTFFRTTAPYVSGYFLANPAMLLSLLATAGLLFYGLVQATIRRGHTLLAWLKNFPPEVLASFVIIVFSLAVVVRNGGDWMPHYRLLAQYSFGYLILALYVSRRSVTVMSMIVLLGVAEVSFRVYDLSKMQCCSLSAITTPDSFYGEAASEIKKLGLDSSVVISSEAAGHLPFILNHSYVHDPLGLADRYLARHGNPGARLGKSDFNYTMSVVKPGVAIWHYAGHLYDVGKNTLDNYYYYCYRRCSDKERASLVMIKKSIVNHSRYQPFAMWQTGDQIAVVMDLGINLD
jgi:hypothetical protein